MIALPAIPLQVHDFGSRLMGRNYFDLLAKTKLLVKGSKHPVLVWQMGKVGSTSVADAIREHYSRASVFHIHALSKTMIFERGNLYRESQRDGNSRYLLNVSLYDIFHQYVSRGGRWKIVTLVRDPVARNLSEFFQNQTPDPGSSSSRVMSLQAATHQHALNTFLADFDHSWPLDWFDVEFGTVLKTDIFSNHFDPSKGFALYQYPDFDILVIRTENLSEHGPQALSTLLEVKPFRINSRNESSNKKYADLRKEILRNAKLPDDYLSFCYESKYARHFYTAEEIDRLRQYWGTTPRQARFRLSS